MTQHIKRTCCFENVPHLFYIHVSLCRMVCQRHIRGTEKLA
ncbi:unnamed protein product [Callosobruchus maculatus]|uniref:Uncharacterized protein n=1 Tax=Callosobruchus maculatus TaxID=64391 RepID=A0A653DCM2_CALMS|nr:unnamed protein product [Callosobruchus maculatus]